MLSIIICSVDPEQLSQVKTSIENTVGIPYEVVAIDNRTQPRGITAVYNEGVRLAQFPYLCFVHEDVLFETPDWGKVVVRTLEDPSIGLLGVAGGGYKSLAPSGWYFEPIPSPLKSFQHIVQGYKFQQKEDLYVNHNPLNQTLSEVVALDGVFFCARKEVSEKHPFDEKTFTGFHGYDVDFSLSVGREYKLVVSYEILIKHVSEGNFDKKWLDETLKVHAKWSAHLPASLSQIQHDESLFKIEKVAFKNLIDEMIRQGYPSKAIFQMVLNSYPSELMTLKRFFKIYFYYLKRSWWSSKVS